MVADDGEYRVEFNNADYNCGEGSDPRKCNICGKALSFSEVFIVATCFSCRKEEVRQARKRRLAQLKTLPVQERLARIEKWIEEHEDCHPMKEILGS